MRALSIVCLIALIAVAAAHPSLVDLLRKESAPPTAAAKQSVDISFPYSCFQIAPYPDVTNLTFYETNGNGDQVYYGFSTLNNQNYAGAYAHIQNSTGYIHITLTYMGRALNRTRVLLIQPGGSGGDTIATTYMVDSNVYGFYTAPQDVTIIPCGSTMKLASTTSHGSGEVAPSAPRPAVQSAATAQVGPYTTGKYCLQLSEYYYYNIYLNESTTSTNNNNALNGDMVYDSYYMEGNAYGLVSNDGNALFVIIVYSSTTQVISTTVTDLNSFNSFGSVTTYAFDNAMVEYWNSYPTYSYSMSSCTAA